MFPRLSVRIDSCLTESVVHSAHAIPLLCSGAGFFAADVRRLSHVGVLALFRIVGEVFSAFGKGANTAASESQDDSWSDI